MAFTRAHTAAITQASAHTQDAHQQFVSHQTRLRTTSATHINNPNTWATPGAAVMAAAMQQIDAELTKLHQTVYNTGLALNSTANVHYAGTLQDEAALAARFAAQLNV
jgi:hypothetical protein